MTSSTLSRDQTHYVFNVTRDAFLEAHGDKRKAIRFAKRNLRDAPRSIIASIAISLAIKFAVWLIMKWIENRFSVPPYEYPEDELGFSGLSASDASTLQSIDIESDE